MPIWWLSDEKARAWSMHWNRDTVDSIYPASYSAAILNSFRPGAFQSLEPLLIAEWVATVSKSRIFDDGPEGTFGLTVQMFDDPVT